MLLNIVVFALNVCMFECFVCAVHCSFCGLVIMYYSFHIIHNVDWIWHAGLRS